ncbi:MAG: hypothetical protein ACR9NN_16220 [Nostochopsis sp.]
MCIVLDYIQKYPLRTKQILGISYEQYQSLLVSAICHPARYAIARHKELENLRESEKVRINALLRWTTTKITYPREYSLNLPHFKEQVLNIY